MIEPPLKSMPKFMSSVTNSTTEAIDRKIDRAKVQRRIPMNGILVPGGTKRDGARGSSLGRARRTQ